MNEMSPIPHHVVRMRREVQRRMVRVTAIESLTSLMRRIRFASDALRDFESLAADDHVKLFVPGRNGELCMRDYTPRAFDPVQGTLTIDFALHEAGPATNWAVAARPGDLLEIGGPRGSVIVPDDFDWYLLIGDETALPAIGRRVETLRPGVPVRTIVVVANQAERQAWVTEAAWEPLWVERDSGRDTDADRLLAALHQAGPLSNGDGFIWIAAEARAAKAVRAHVVEVLGQPKQWVKASGYWVAGQPDAHVNFDD
jgi:NADPH-dependent ferric siderophore reductase